MKTLAKSVIVILVAVACFGCASDNPTEAPPRDAPNSTTGHSTSAPEDQTQAVAVTFRKTGGLRPVDERTTFSADASPPAGYSQAQVDSILDAASDPAFKDLDMPKVPANACCDLQSYQVTIAWADGSSRTLATVDGLEEPKLFQDLLGMF